VLVKGNTGVGDFTSAAMALAMIAAIALAAGGVKPARERANRVRGFLMIAAAAVLVANVLVWTI
jgi:high-affinity Fe2+/Pb2+ permease